MEPPPLPVAGTYQFMLDPVGNGTGTTAVTLYNIPADVTGTIQPDGSPVTVTIEEGNPGQNALISFPGSANQRVSLLVSQGSPIGTVSLLRTDGTIQASVSTGPAAVFMEPQNLATSGTYTLKADPFQANTGSITLSLYDVPPDIAEPITVGAPPLQLTLQQGQKAYLSFNGTQGQQVTVRMTGNGIGSTTVTLRKPDESQLVSTTSLGTNFNLPMQTLPVTGTYTILVDPTGANSGAISVAVTTP
jgi:hypothetical protein